RDEYEIRDTFSEPVGLLAERGEVDVVFDGEGSPETLAERVQHARTAPPGEVRSEPHGVAPRIDDARATDHRVRNVLVREARFDGDRRGEIADLRDEPMRLARLRSLLTTQYDFACQVGERDAEPTPADVEPDDPAGLGPHLVEQRGAAAV